MVLFPSLVQAQRHWTAKGGCGRWLHQPPSPGMPGGAVSFNHSSMLTRTTDTWCVSTTPWHPPLSLTTCRHFNKIQDFDTSFYKRRWMSIPRFKWCPPLQKMENWHLKRLLFWFYLFPEFHIIVCGLDSIIARRWMNGMLVDQSVVCMSKLQA